MDLTWRKDRVHTGGTESPGERSKIAAAGGGALNSPTAVYRAKPARDLVAGCRRQDWRE